MELELTKTEAKELAKKWGAKDFVLADEIIDAYQEGKKVGIIRMAAELEKRRQEKLLTAMRVSIQSISELEEKLHLDIQASFLRQMVSDDECFHSTLIVINKEKYLEDTARQAYRILMDKAKSLRESKELTIDFALMPQKDDLNSDLLLGDGYSYHYVKKESSRT